MSADGSETVLWQGCPSWKSMLLFHVKWTILALAPIAIWIGLDAAGADVPALPFAAATAVVLVASLLVGWVRRATTRYTITDRRIRIRTGLVSRVERSTHVERVQNLGVSQTIAQRLLGIGDVEWDTAGTDTGDADFTFRGVDDPAAVLARADVVTREPRAIEQT